MKIGYSKTFPLHGKDQWEKIWIEDEAPIDIDFANYNEKEIEDAMLHVRKIQYALKKQVENFHYESKGAEEKQMGTHIIPDRNWNTNPYTYQEVAGVMNLSLEEQIQSCTDKKVLESYRLLVKNNPKLEKIYLEKLKEFV